MHEEIVRMFDLTGKVALITGGAVHLGYDMSCILAGAGCSVAITSRSISRAQESAKKLNEKYGAEVLPLELDQTDPVKVAEVVKKAQEWKGHIDILVNNVGGGSGKGVCHLFERSPDDISKLIELNLTGVLYCCREAGKIMAKQQSGKIINIASMAGIVGRDRRMYERNNMAGQPIDYAAAKAGVIGMTRDLAGLLSPMGINVNAISPGGFNRDLPEGFVRDYSDRTPLGRMGRDGVDIKGAVLFLASPASDYVTGHNLVVDGGFSIWQ
ncbi:MAG: SDR family oxidoreductase [Kiritimatiellae bacterium]|nr:SDR family oxidoreductase [Verrucomicrobiota bacterium]MBU4366776.1 SDR family oxidoreductase [Verrucomicrobiota bacterium]MCG2659078.1 SDR family oxidoreductase [Kiritimatiellia bacterium]